MPGGSPNYAVDLCQHLAECETNFVRLRKLMPDMQLKTNREIAVSVGASIESQVKISVTEDGPYTTTLRLRQSRGIGGLRAPEMTVRVYHDLRVAEVITYQHIRAPNAVYTYPNRRMHVPDEKRQLNLLLGEWLSMCLVHGHESEPVTLV